MTTSTLSGRDAATPCTVATDLFLDSIDAALEETPFVYTERVALGEDSKTTVHVLRQELRNTVVTVADLGSAKRVTDVCTESGGRVVAAINTGVAAVQADAGDLPGLYLEPLLKVQDGLRRVLR